MGPSPNVDICRRIAQVRAELAGPRGRASFAQLLGISTSTYQNYETSRVPPAAVLLKIADLAGADLRWLLTGQTEGPAKAPPSHPVLLRAASLLGEKPDAAEPLAAFLDILSASLGFPQEKAGGPPPARPLDERAAAPAAGEDPRIAWIPVLGRSAAGVPHFWAGGRQAPGVRMLDELIDRHARRCGRRARPASVSAEDQAGDTSVQIVSLSEPVEGEVAEFLAAPSVKARHGDSFALRIDGDSMAPEIRHGDLVILSPSVGAADGRAAVVQLAGQIGVTCKLYRREGRTAHLIPINEAFDPQSFPVEKVVWALRVLARVRPQPT